MKKFTFDTVLDADKVLMDKVAGTIKASEAYQIYRMYGGNEKVNYRTGSFTFILSDEAFKRTDGCLKQVFLKKVDTLLADLAIVVGDKSFITNRDGCQYTIQRIGIHTVTKKNVPKTAAKGAMNAVAGKIVRLAEVLSKLNELTTYPNFLVTFYRRDDHGEKVNTSYEVGINRIDRSRDNYDACVIAEAARLMREITDTVTYDGFVPDMARIVAHDTGDVYNLEF